MPKQTFPLRRWSSGFGAGWMQRPYCTWSRPRIVSADTASQFGAGTEFFVDQQSCVVAFAQERRHQAQNSADLRIRKTVDELCAPRSPVQALHLVGQNDPGYRKTLGDCHLERVSLDSTRYGAKQARPTLRLYADGDNTSAGRRPACSCPACGVNESQTISPRRGT